MKINQMIKSARAKKHYSIRDVENKSKGAISNAYICKIEKGKVGCITPQMLRTLSEVLDLNYLELLIHAGHVTIRDLKGRV